MPSAQAALLSFSINIPIFQYFACIFSILQIAPYMMYVLNSPTFSIYGQNSVKILTNPILGGTEIVDVCFPV